MRIIAGKNKKMNLFSVPGKTSRPTTDYMREWIFSILQDVTGLSVLDLFAGSGALGLEALSRGAANAVFVDASQSAVATILKNVEKMKVQDISRIHKKRYNAFLNKTEEKFELIFLDPPYKKDMVNEALDLIYENKTFASKAMIVIEHSKREVIHDKWTDYCCFRKVSGESAVTILEV